MRRGLLVLTLAALAPLAGQAQPAGDSVGDRIRASEQAAESYQGPLDGPWTLVSATGQAIFAFQLVDRVGGAEPLEGVWRDLRKPTTPGDIHFIDAIIRRPTGLVITLNAAPGSPLVTITLQSEAGGWRGVMRENGVDAPVRLRRS